MISIADVDVMQQDGSRLRLRKLVPGFDATTSRRHLDLPDRQHAGEDVTGLLCVDRVVLLTVRTPSTGCALTAASRLP